ncbi:ABC transporter ATP-binding protein [Inquilinus sp. CAU 1745]|uniref:ABC transporter ATP-binding protein n=1 Tax=Inquilinus sp. CAU 1745 TaxID=3140369 RepID=UPI00325A4D31
MSLLEVSGVSKRFGGLAALQDVNLNIHEGSIHAIIGPNGAGKSTLLNVLTGRIAPDKGTVMFNGESLLGLAPYKINQKGVARVFQTPEIFPEMTLLENIAISALSARDGSFKLNFLEHPRKLSSVRKEAEEALAEVGLNGHEDQEARHLSRGDKRRLELAVCLAVRPKLLLLDEPTAGMSQHDTQGTIELLKKISARGMTKIIIEHDMGVVFSLSQRISVLHQGRVIADGTPDEIRANDAVQEAYLGGAHI